MPDETKTPVPSIAEVRSEVELLETDCIRAGLLGSEEKLILDQASHHDGTIFYLVVEDVNTFVRRTLGDMADSEVGVGRRAAHEKLAELRRWAQDQLSEEQLFEMRSEQAAPSQTIAAEEQVAEVMAAWEEARTLLEVSVPKAEVLDKIVSILADRTKEWDLLTLAAIGSVIIAGGYGHASNGWFKAGPR